MFRFCIANTEEDWRPGTEQYKFIEHCLSSVDRQKQPWLIFLAHRVLGYSSGGWYEIMMGSYGEPMGREGLQDLWQKYKVDLAVFGHIHSYERTCPVYQVRTTELVLLFQTLFCRSLLVYSFLSSASNPAVPFVVVRYVLSIPGLPCSLSIHIIGSSLTCCFFKKEVT
jgi:hypothetical protein